MLELLLTYAVQRQDVKPVARRLLERFHNLNSILDAGVDDLCQVEGVGRNSAILISLIRNFCTLYLKNNLIDRDVLDTKEKMDDFVRMSLSIYTDEAFLVIFLDVKNRIISSKVFGPGSVDTIFIQPKKIAEDAVAYKAHRLVVAHNHPSGETDPSSADITFTRKLENVLASLDILLLEHLVVSSSGVYSFLNHGLLAVKR